jgi:hypothetical protein
MRTALSLTSFCYFSGYVAIAIEDKAMLTTEDYCVLSLMFLSIAFGFLMNFSTDFNYGVGLFIASSICMTGTVWCSAV